MTTTLYWHDYETWGEIPARDRPSQFAGVRTDTDLNIIGAPLMLYCQPTTDMLPKPEACLITGITPQQALAQGVPEPEFIRRVHAELSRPGTCGVGYNTLRFDDEVTRYTLYRNFYDPYEREWRHGNSRWDIIDMVRLTRALRPEGIEWPLKEDGSPSFRLEDLTAANGISHSGAHDALADVHATIAVARLIKTRQPELYDYLFNLRSKHKVAALVDILNRKPLLHISSMYPASRGCAAVVAPLAMHPGNSNGVIVFDLSADPTPLLTLSAAEIRARLFTRSADLPVDVERLPLKVVHLNKCPVLTTVKLLDSAAQARWGIDLARCEAHWQQLRGTDLAATLREVFSGSEFEPAADPEQQLYSGFLSDADKHTCEAVRCATPEQLATQTFVFHDRRLPELLFRYRARHFPQSLSAPEQAQWQQFRTERLTDPAAGAGIVLEEYLLQLDALEQRSDLSAPQRAVVLSLRHWAADLGICPRE